MKIRTRIAPSPTGDLHIGHLRTVLFNYALSKKSEGQFVVRIEDTDRNRFIEGAMDRTLDVINAYALDWDEGPRVGGDYEPYVQSERLDIYKDLAEQLVAKGKAYYCFLSAEETKELQKVFRSENRRFRSPHRELSKQEIEEKLNNETPYVIRLKIPENEEISFNDEVVGTVTYKSEEIDDQILLKQDGFPTYHLAVVIDDHLMKITHVLRGNDWLPSTPKHILLYKAFEWGLPKYAHLPNLKEKEGGKKLSKRHGAVFAIQFLEEGYLPAALLNFLMLLGWSSPKERTHGEAEQELYSLEEFVELFSLDRVQKTALVSFDREKLVWFNKQYLKNTDRTELKDYFLKWIDTYKKDSPVFEQIMSDMGLENKLDLVKERARTLTEVLEMLEFFYERPVDIDWSIKQVKRVRENVKEVQSEIVNLIEGLDNNSKLWLHGSWEDGMREIGDKLDVKHGDVFMVLRLIVVGSPVSPPLFESLQILGKEEVLKRVKI